MNDLDEARQHVLHACRDQDVKFIRLWFTDILGILKSVAITIEELEHALRDGIAFDGSSIEGFARSSETDMVALPDPATFQLLPWRPKEQAVARMICDVQAPRHHRSTARVRRIAVGCAWQLARPGWPPTVSEEATDGVEGQRWKAQQEAGGEPEGEAPSQKGEESQTRVRRAPLAPPNSSTAR